MSTMAVISAWLAETSLSVAVSGAAWVIPTVQAIHILAIAIVLSSVAMLDLRLAGLIGREQPIRSMTLRFYPWIWGALAVLLVTGFIMIMGEPDRELRNWIFWAKMALIVSAVLVTMPVRRMLDECRFRDLAPNRQQVIRLLALVSLLLWVTVIVCGRWIAYAGEKSL
jgi:uncharacterized membrane protein